MNAAVAFFDIASALALFAIAVAGAWLPKWLSKKSASAHTRDTARCALSLGNMLSGGVMLSAGFVHLLGAALPDIGLVRGYPLATMLAGLGFLATLVADQLVEVLHDRGGEMPPSIECAVHAHSHALHAAESGCCAGSHPLSDSAVNGSAQHDFIADGLTGREDSRLHSRDEAANSRQHLLNGSHPPSANVSLGFDDSADKHSTSELAQHAQQPKHAAVSFVTAVLLACALSVHSVLEGAAMGAQRDMARSAHVMFAIFAHKGLAAYALGSSIAESDATPRAFWTTTLLFAAATPVGVCLGMAISAFAAGVAGACLSALAAGTFLYVALMEVIPREIERSEYRLAKLLTLIAGFVVMSLLGIVA